MVSSGLTLSNDTGMIIYSGGKAENTTVNKGGGIIIFDSGTANNTTINYSAFMMISSGGTANFITVNSNGGIIISTDGTANSTTLNSGGFMGISSGGTANGAIVNKGRIEILSGGTATNVVWTPCEGEIIADTGAYVTYTSNYYGVYFGSNNQLLSHTLSMSKKNVSTWCDDDPCSMYVMNSGVANITITFVRKYMTIIHSDYNIPEAHRFFFI